MKRDFLVHYDYGQGAVWAIVNARSASEIRGKFPDLKVARAAPIWMTAVDRKRISQRMRFDVDRPTGWLALLADGSKSEPRKARSSSTLLTPRERQVLEAAAEGASTAEIAERLSITPRTVQDHFRKIMDKLGVRSRPDAVHVAVQQAKHRAPARGA